MTEQTVWIVRISPNGRGLRVTQEQQRWLREEWPFSEVRTADAGLTIVACSSASLLEAKRLAMERLEEALVKEAR